MKRMVRIKDLADIVFNNEQEQLWPQGFEGPVTADLPEVDEIKVELGDEK